MFVCREISQEFYTPRVVAASNSNITFLHIYVWFLSHAISEEGEEMIRLIVI